MTLSQELIYRPALEAIGALDSDHAREDNGVGFSSADGTFAHAMIEHPRAWSVKQCAAVYKILKRYSRTQLPALGFDFATFPDPPTADDVPARSASRSAIATPSATIAVDGKQLRFAWGFDDHFHLRLSTIKSITGRTYHAATKSWEIVITINNAEQILNALDSLSANGAGFDDDTAAREAIARAGSLAVKTIASSEAEDSDIEITGLIDNSVLLPYQRAGVEHIIRHKRTIVADEMGLGKTLMSIAAMTTSHRERVLIICPASLKGNWSDEIVKWTGEEAEGEMLTIDGKKSYTLAPVKWTIINYDLLSSWINELSIQDYDAIIVDEAHMLKSGTKSQRGKAFTDLVNRVQPEYLALLTGTPILNRPIEMWPLLRAVGGSTIVGGWKHFIARYCDAKNTSFGLDLTGASNLVELNTTLRSSGLMIRRRKTDVLKELPPRRWARVEVPLSVKTSQEYAAIRADGISKQSEPGAILTMMGQLRQLVAAEKTQLAIDWIERFLESEEQLIVFSWHREVAETIAARFNAPKIIGGMNRDVIDQGKADFQSGKARVIVCNIAAGGVGHTLTAASNVLFIEQAWNGALMDQALDRAHRIGQKASSVTGWVLVSRLADRNDTIDQYMFEMIESKRAVVSGGTDGRNIANKWLSVLIEQEASAIEHDDLAA